MNTNPPMSAHDSCTGEHAFAINSASQRPVCAQCGSQFRFSKNGEKFCVSCLLRTALGEERVDDATRAYRFDQYELVTDNDGAPVELGRGAMGVTYKAFDTNLRCEVALKVIRACYLANESSRAHFLSEARSAAQLRHRNIASVFHLGGEGADYFYAMELVEGETIEERVRRKGPLDPATALDVSLQITRALIAAGSRQFVHRDVKPSNIMLSTEADGVIVAKLIDFGLVRPASSPPTRPNAGLGGTRFSGTPYFASPEQFNGKTTDGRADIYSLGVTLWYMLTGKLPFSGTREEIQQQQLSGTLPLDQLKRVQRPLVELIKRMLDCVPAKRPQSPGALKDQLNKCIAAIDVAKQKQRRRFAYSLLAAVALILAGSGAFYIFQRKLQPSRPSEIVPAKSIAVLPFQNLSRDPDNAFFADGVQDEILADLSKIADLKVISRTSVMAYKSDTPRNLRAIAQELGVANVVEGSVQRSGNRVRVNAQLIDARNDRHLWASTYDRELADMFVIQSEIAKMIADQLQARLLPHEKSAIERPPTSDLSAFDLYTRANNLLLTTSFSTTARTDLLQAVDLLNQAVARDPSFFDAYCQLAYVHHFLYFRGFDHTSARLAAAEAAVDAAARIRPNAGEMHIARAQNLCWGYLDYNGALAELEFARQTLPNDLRIIQLTGSIQRSQGRWEESIRSLERAIDLDPRNVYWLQQTALTYEYLRRYAEEKSLLDRILVIAPYNVKMKLARAAVDWVSKGDTLPVHQAIDSIRTTDSAALPRIADYWLWCALGERDAVAAEDAVAASGNNPLTVFYDNVYFNHSFYEGVSARMAGDSTKAQSAFLAARAEQEKIVQAQPNYGPALCVLGLINAGLGRKEEALSQGRRAIELCPVDKDAVHGTAMIKYFAIIAAWIGDKDLACEQLASIVHRPGDLNYGDLKLLPFWDPLRGDPRFEKLVQQARQPIALR